MHASPAARRDFLLGAARKCLGVSLLPWALPGVGAFGGDGATSAAGTGAGLAPEPTATSVIYLFMRGGMSHIDTFDPKPETPEVQGPVDSIATRTPGVRFTEWLPGLAGISDRFAVVRSLHHTQGNHGAGTYKMRTGYEQRPDLNHPAVGAWASRLAEETGRPAPNTDLPRYVRVGGLAGHPVNGFFDVKHAPLPILNARDGLPNGRLRPDMTPETFRRDLDLAADLDANFLKRYRAPNANAYAGLYAEAARMMRSDDLVAFDVMKEPGEVRERYGKGGFGEGCLLARRLVESGVRFVEVDLGGWDTHTDNHKGVQGLCGALDQTLTVLLEDLRRRGLLDTTLVVLTTEFGRTPKIDDNGGRNHSPIGYTSLLAGGGIRGGAVHGATDARGHHVADAPTSVLDFNATVGHALGLPVELPIEAFAGSQRFTLAGKDTAPVKGAPLLDLFG